MKKLFWRILIGMLCIACVGCATIKKPEKVTSTNTAPVVSPTLQQETETAYHGLKRKVAIGRFTNETKYGRSFLLNKNNDRIGKQAVDILSEKLVQTDKFILLERADLEKIQAELSLGDAGQLKNMADYLIVGSITEFGRKETSEVGVFSRTRKQVAYATVSIRLIDVYTGEIIYSESGSGEAFMEVGSVFGVGGRSSYDSTLNDKAIDAAITTVASNIIENLMDKPWRSYILGYEEGMVIIGGGKSQGVKQGDRFTVVKEGKKVKNRQTNSVITLPGKEVAELEVIETYGKTQRNEVSFCRVVSGNLSSYIASGKYEKLLVEEQ
ncbi:CsgG/HfaB family protein [Halodesulfovibrio aestuarii]|uniref:Curli biogenesis system outer membrane secretion channel CsgG n=1 Tax=Halodesulfovibrio aestuarii TaxID=126333 RepID=A0A8G2F8K4_9BACT|nr:CsgG/HfaB family protein [Halodesulfovibrio aestuarii]SHI83509.1 Curli biogenesis system outer membrane secretion channel CsgG [Halodesulfovibrio aestuarii]